MKNKLDAILIIVASLVLAGGLYLGMSINSDADFVKEQDGTVNWTSKSIQFEEIAPVSWLRPEAQIGKDDMPWDYQVFTPPKIWYNPITDVFEAEPPASMKQYLAEKEMRKQPKCTAKLIEFSSKPYRFSLDGVIGSAVKLSDSKNPNSKPILLVEGQEKDGIKIIKIEKKIEEVVEIGANNRQIKTVKPVFYVVLHDSNLNRDINLSTENKTAYIEEERIAVLSIKDGMDNWFVQKAGESMDFVVNGDKNVKCVIKEVDYNAQTVEIELLYQADIYNDQVWKLTKDGKELISEKKKNPKSDKIAS